MAAVAMAMTANAQGNNTRMGGCEEKYESLAERVTNIEKKTDAFNVYFNYAASAQAEKIGDGDWTTRMANKQFRLEIKGNLTDRLSYRLRHRMNKCDAAKSQDNFAQATDIMMMSYKFNDKVALSAGKMCQIWGGFEFDENPMYIYQYSDMVDNMNNFMAGAVVSIHPVESQELAFEISNADNEYQNYAGTKTANHPLTYIANWNGSFADGKINTRWSWGAQSQGKDVASDNNLYSKMLILGQQLNLPKLQWYVDYMGEYDNVDRLGICSGETGVARNVNQHSFITKLNYQFAPQWNLMLKGMYEITDAKNVEALNNYRTSLGYIGSIEYYPEKSQDLRFFLAYVGRSFKYSDKAKAAFTNLDDYNTSRIELGFMYRIKCF